MSNRSRAEKPRSVLQGTVASRLGRGVSAQGILQLVQLFIRVAEVPLLVGVWGATEYGTWLMLVSIASLLAVADGGLAKAAQRTMTMHVGALEHQQALRSYQLSWTLLALVVLALAAAVGAGLAVLNVVSPNSFTLGSSSSQTFLILALQISLNFHCNILYAGFASHGMYAAGTLYQAATYLAAFCLLAIAVVAGGGMREAAAASCVGYLIGIVLTHHGLCRRVGYLRYSWRRFSISELKTTARIALPNAAYPIADWLNIYGIRLIVGSIFGPVALAAFSATRTLCRLALQPVLAIARSIESELSLAFGARDLDSMRNLVRRGSQVAVWGGLVLCVALLVAGPIVFHLWTAKSLAFDAAVFALLLTASFVNSIWAVAMAVPCSMNDNRTAATAYFWLHGVGTIVLSVVFAKVFMAGASVASAILLIEMAIGVLIMREASRKLSAPLLALIAPALRPPVFVLKYIRRASHE